MRSLLLTLFAVGVVATATGAYLHHHPTRLPIHLQGEADEGRTPPDGDYWAIRASYPTMHFEPTWLLAAAEQERRIAAGVPAGERSYSRSTQSPLTLDPNAFTLLGPKPQDGGWSAGPVAGRTNVIAVDPVDPTIAWLGSDGGGVWKTTNCCSAATTWQIKTDVPEVASIAIGDIAIDPSNHDTIYAGTGDLRFGSFSFGAAGVLKSTDQGETWRVLGADVFNPLYGPSAGIYPQYQAIGKVVVDPNDSNRLVVGAKTGVYFSYDAGDSWAGPCYTNAFGSGAGAQRQDITGLLAVDRGGSTVLYAAVGTRGLPTPVQPDLVNNGANGVYRTAMPASGCPASWSLLANGWPAGTGNGVPNASRGRIEIAAAPSDNQVLYAMVSNIANNGVLGVWRTADGGDTWTQASPGTFSGCGGEGTQMWYDSGLTVSPTDPNTVFASTVDLFRSTNGGATFSNLTSGYCGGPVHVDHHARAVVGGDANRLLVGSDGGVVYSANALAATPSWTSLSSSLSTTEFYHGDITADFATAAAPGAVAGAQDNGTSTVVFSGDPQATTWIERNGGDGIVGRIEPVLGKRWYYSSQNGNLRVTSNGPASSTSAASGPWSGDRLSFVMPFDLYRYGDTSVPGSGCDTTIGCSHLIAGTVAVWETLTGAVPTSSWKKKTGDLTKGTLVLGSDNRSYINNLHYAVSDPTVAMVGTNDGNVQYVFGLGGSGMATAVNVTGGNAVLPNRPIQDVATDPANPWLGYAAVGGFAANTVATPGHVFQVSCSAQCASYSWLDKSGNLPDIPANAVTVNPHLPKQVFVGMDWGLYYTDDISAATPVWQRFEGLPHVMVWSLTIDRGFTTLAAFTRSRGAWAWPLPTAPSGDSADLEVTLAAPAQVVPGTRLSYTLTVSNNGPSTAANVQLASPTPPGLTFAGNGGDCSGAFPCVFGTLAAGASKTVTTSLCVPRGYAGPLALSASAMADTPDPVPGNNSASANPLVIIDSVFVDGFDPCP